jgi:hypothetical protein
MEFVCAPFANVSAMARKRARTEMKMAMYLFSPSAGA